MAKSSSSTSETSSSVGKDFFERVHEVVRKVPYGRVTSYGAIAEHLGAKRSARLVGYAMNASHNLPDVPAWRVVNRNGLLTGKKSFATPDLMQELLESEGVKVEDDEIVEFETLFWHPDELYELDERA